MTDKTETFDPGTARNTTNDWDSSSAKGGWDDRAHRLLDDFERGWLRGERPGADSPGRPGRRARGVDQTGGVRGDQDRTGAPLCRWRAAGAGFRVSKRWSMRSSPRWRRGEQVPETATAVGRNTPRAVRARSTKLGTGN